MWRFCCARLVGGVVVVLLSVEREGGNKERKYCTVTKYYKIKSNRLIFRTEVEI
jgi:hypothetical protein